MNKPKVVVKIPSQMTRWTGGDESFVFRADTVGDALDALASFHNGIGGRIFNDEGELNHFLIFTLNDVDIRFSQGRDTRVKEDDVISITTAIAGG